MPIHIFTSSLLDYSLQRDIYDNPYLHKLSVGLYRVYKEVSMPILIFTSSLPDDSLQRDINAKPLSSQALCQMIVYKDITMITLIFTSSLPDDGLQKDNNDNPYLHKLSA